MKRSAVAILGVSALVLGLAAASLSAQPAVPGVSSTDEDRLLYFHADKCLDSLEGRDWLLSDLPSLEILARRAEDRGMTLTLVPVVQRPGGSAAWRDAVAALGNKRLDVAAELGPVVFLREWMRTVPEDAVKRVALMALPDLWASAGLVEVPGGLLFLGAKDAVSANADMDARLARHRALWDETGEQIARTQTTSPALAETRMRLRRQIAWVANNLGVALFGMDRRDDAFEAFSRARALDPQNVSALLNRAVCVKQGVRPELAQQIGQELEGLRENLPDPRALWSLTQIFGRVVGPEEFVPLGWIWTLSGIPAFEEARWKAALEVVGEEHREAVRRQLAASHAGQTGATDAEMRLLDVLAGDAANAEALIVLARRASAQGRTGDAERWLLQAAETGVPATTLMAERAAMLTSAGKSAEAREMLEKSLVETPDSWQLLALLATLQAEAGDAAELEETVARLEAVKDIDPYHVLVSRGRLFALQGKNWQARDALLEAIKQKPSAVFLYDFILPLDFAMDDKRSAETHADLLLQAMPSHAFANYIKGSLLLERKEYPAAELHFRRSLDSNVTVPALNDFAVLLLETKRPREAEAMARRTTELNGRLAAAWDTLATALAALDRHDEAYAAMEKAMAAEGAQDPRIQLHWARMLYQRGDREPAKEAAEKAHAKRLQLSPQEREELLRLRDQLKLGK